MVWIGRHPLDAGMRAVCPGVVVLPLEPPQVLSYDDVVRLAGFAPEAVVYSDKSGPPPFTDIERFPCLTVFYCVDSHIHAWHPHYAHAPPPRRITTACTPPSTPGTRTKPGPLTCAR